MNSTLRDCIAGLATFSLVFYSLLIAFALLYRSDKASVKNITYVSQRVHESVLNASGYDKLNIVYTGIKMFARNSKHCSCDFRICQDGLRVLFPYLTKRRAFIHVDDFVRALANCGNQIPNAELHPLTTENLREMEQGAVACVLGGD